MKPAFQQFMDGFSNIHVLQQLSQLLTCTWKDTCNLLAWGVKFKILLVEILANNYENKDATMYLLIT